MLDVWEPSEGVANIKDIQAAMTMLVCTIDVNDLSPVHIGKRKGCAKLSARSYDVSIELINLKGAHAEVDIH
mgnify:CR=1 FL=1